MNSAQRHNLQRLFKPRHLAIIGGRDAEIVIGECKRIGFAGEIWPVNPKRDEIGGYPCCANVEDLPQAPDAAYVAIHRDAAVATVKRLNAMGGGGVVCYSAGFGETAGAGMAAEAALVAAAGNMALIGPNCYGLINYIDRVALWPFAHSGASPGYGAGIITQSGMLASDITMSQRSLPFAYVISAGNQAVLALEDFVEFLCDQPEVRAIGLHIEGLKDITRFSAAAGQAMAANIPIVALKSGSSEIGGHLTVSHTGSLSGTDDLYQALFDKLGIIRVSNPAQLIETLKFLCIAGPVKGHRVAGITCSGGSAIMLADHAEQIGLGFPKPSGGAAVKLRETLPGIATVSNPQDYTTKIWGDAAAVRPVFDALFEDPYDAAIMVQDYPLPGLDESARYYRNDAMAFVAAAAAKNIPAAVCCTLPENMGADTRDLLVARGVAPMQGIHEALNAIAAAASYSQRRAEILAARSEFAPLICRPFETMQLDEWAGKSQLKAAGINVPDSAQVSGREAGAAAVELGFPVALKMVSAALAHKTDVGAVRLGLRSEAEVAGAVEAMRLSVGRASPNALRDNFLIERMVDGALAELMVSVRGDAQFGLAMTIASGGVLVELMRDARTILLPTTEAEILAALNGLKIARLFDGYRGAQTADKSRIVAALMALAEFTTRHIDRVAEIEINPMLVLPDGVWAVDVLIQVRQD